MRHLRLLTASTAILALGACSAPSSSSSVRATSTDRDAAPTTPLVLERVTTKVPFPRGLTIHDGKLYALCRGRVRDYGGVTAAVNDQAGTIYEVDPSVAEFAKETEISAAVRDNGTIFTEPDPHVFKLWDRAASPPNADRLTDRPYCGLRFHPGTHSFYLCAFSGVDMGGSKTGKQFSKNLSDAILRYDLRTKKWYEVERHDTFAGGNYPHHDPKHHHAPHGWLNGPDNCLAVGDWLYAVAKDNNVLARYDLRALKADPEAGAPPSEIVLGNQVACRGHGTVNLAGHSMLAYHDGFLYLGTRTSSHVVRIAMTPDGEIKAPIIAELLAMLPAYDAETKKSANLTDMAVGPDGMVYMISASPARVYRFRPDPTKVWDARDGSAKPYADLAAMTDNPKMKSENLLVADNGDIFVTSGDGYAIHQGSGGVIWRLRRS